MLPGEALVNMKALLITHIRHRVLQRNLQKVDAQRQTYICNSLWCFFFIIHNVSTRCWRGVYKKIHLEHIWHKRNSLSRKMVLYKDNINVEYCCAFLLHPICFDDLWIANYPAISGSLHSNQIPVAELADGNWQLGPLIVVTFGSVLNIYCWYLYNYRLFMSSDRLVHFPDRLAKPRIYSHIASTIMVLGSHLLWHSRFSLGASVAIPITRDDQLMSLSLYIYNITTYWM